MSMEFISVRDAWKVVLDKALSKVRLDRLTIQVHKSLGYFIADDVIAKVSYPKRNIALFDGYAVRAEDTTSASINNPVALRIVYSNVIGPFEAKPINVGEPLPGGANAVIPHEYVNLEGNIIEALKPIEPHANVALRGEDVRSGDIIASKGTYIDKFLYALLLRAGLNEIPVFRRIRVGILTIGDEIVRDMNLYLTKEDVVYDITSPLISASLTTYCDVIDLGIIKDDESAISHIIKNVENIDVIITLGGTSLGKRDVTVKVMEKEGEIIFHGVSIVPGRTMAFGLIHDKPTFMLSGFPVAAFVQMKLLVEPYVLKVYNAKIRVFPILAELSRRISSTIGFLNVVRVTLNKQKGKVIANPLRLRGSGVLSSISLADAVLLLSEDIEGFEAGDIVSVYKKEEPWGFAYVEGDFP
ncbi:MAG: molybdopterin molybdotransferase MoeA [Thermoprotei archaeon]|nr:molybdopterin molybdotransferase MoeA [Thermoprotei archaeon]